MSQINKNELSCRLKAFSLICAGLVVFVHCVPDEILGALQFSPGWWLYRLWTETVCRMAVPAFFFMSRYWLAKRAEKNGWWKDAVQKRIKSLLVPYVIWNIGYWALVTFELWLGMRFFGKAGPEPFTWRTIPDALEFTTATPYMSQLDVVIHCDPYVTYIVMWGLALIVSVAITLLIRRFAPRVADVIYGG